MLPLSTTVPAPSFISVGDERVIFGAMVCVPASALSVAAPPTSLCNVSVLPPVLPIVHAFVPANWMWPTVLFASRSIAVGAPCAVKFAFAPAEFGATAAPPVHVEVVQLAPPVQVLLKVCSSVKPYW